VRRIIFALLVSVLTAVVPLSSPAGAAIAVKPPKVAPARLHRMVVATPLRRALVVAASRVRLNIDGLRHEWQQVAICEVAGDWDMVGPIYSGIGFANGTWTRYGGRRYAPLAGEASRDQQILVGMRVTHGQVPDQNGCSPYGW
jgi:hypothetical protein